MPVVQLSSAVVNFKLSILTNGAIIQINIILLTKRNLTSNQTPQHTIQIIKCLMIGGFINLVVVINHGAIPDDSSTIADSDAECKG